MPKERPFNPDLYVMIEINGQPAKVTLLEFSVLKKLADSQEPTTIGDLANFWLEKQEKPVTSISLRMKAMNKKFEKRIGSELIETIATPLEGNKTRKIKSYRIREDIEINFQND